MSRQLTAASTLDNLKKEAKRWLKALRADDPRARERLRRAYPDAPTELGLRDVQRALALEHGLAGWHALKAAVAEYHANRGDASNDTAFKSLMEAAQRGDVSRLSALLDGHPGVIDERGGSGTRTALHAAAIGGHEPVVKVLLDRGADPNIRCEGDAATPLHFAAEQEHLGIIRLLIEHGADPIGDGDYHELDVIGWATCFGKASTDVVDYLLAHGAEHNIFSAVATGAVDAIRRLAAERRANLDRRMDLANKRRMPLHLAVVKNQPASLVTLLDCGANIEALDEGGLTALDQAALGGHAEMAQLLIDRGADIRLPGAIALERSGDIEALLRKDPECLKPGNRWGTLIVRASEQARGHVIEMLIRAGASVNVRDSPKTSVDSTSGYTPLHAAAFFGNAEAAAVLLRHGADVNAREEMYSGTPAGWANYAGHTAIRDLIAEGPIDIFEAIARDRPARIPGILARDPDALERPFERYLVIQSSAGQWWPDPSCTPLRWAVTTNNAEAARVLLEQGADATVRDGEGRTLVEIASDEERTAVASMLKQHGGSR